MVSFSRTFRILIRILFLTAFLQFVLTPLTSKASWIEEQSWRYLSEDGSYKQNDWLTDSAGKTYYFDHEGRMVTGWLDLPSDDTENAPVTYFFDNNGVMVKGLCEIGGRLYLFNDDGRLFTGIRSMEGTELLLGRDGAEIPSELQGLAKAYDDNGNIIREAGESAYKFPTYLLTSFVFLAGAVLFISINRKKGLTETSFIIAAVFMSSLPLFLDYIIYGHDLTFQLNRILGITASLKNGMFPVRLNGFTFNGYGYADPVFYPNLFMHIPAVLFGIGLSFTAAVHIFLLLINMASALSMYYCGKRIFGSAQAGCISSILYTLSIYRLLNEYTRAAYGELLAMVFIPLAVCGLYELFYGDERKWPLLAATFTGIFQSHLISTVLTALGCLIFGIISIRRLSDRKRLMALIKVCVFTLLLNLWTLIPLIQYILSGIDTSVLQFKAEDNSVPVSMFFDIFPNASGNTPSPIKDLSGAMPMSLGLGILAGIFILIVWRIRTKARQDSKKAIYMLTIGIALLFVSSSLFPWELLVNIPLISTVCSYMQFPWRLQTYSVCFLSLACGFGFAKLMEGKRSICIYGLPMLLALISSQYYMGQVLHQQAEVWNEYDVSASISNVEYLYPGADTSRAKGNTFSEGAVVTGISKNGFSITLNYEPTIEENDELSIDDQNGNARYIEVPLFYYPNYMAEDENGNRLDLRKGSSNVIRVMIPDNDDGSGWMHIYYKEPLTWRIMEIISLMTLAGLTIYEGRRYFKARRTTTTIR